MVHMGCLQALLTIYARDLMPSLHMILHYPADIMRAHLERMMGAVNVPQAMGWNGAQQQQQQPDGEGEENGQEPVLQQQQQQ